MTHKFQTGMAKPGVSLLLLELFNYRLLPLYRYDDLVVTCIIVPYMCIYRYCRAGRHKQDRFEILADFHCTISL